MVDEDLELEEDIGEATIVYDDPEAGTTEKTIPNEHVAYFQDHWIIKTDEDDHGRDIVRRIPSGRVHYVERTVEEFESEVQTILDRVESVATKLQTKIPIGGSDEETREPHRINVAPGDDQSDSDLER